MVDEELLDVAHHPQRELRREDAGVLGLVFLQDVGLDRAPDPAQRVGSYPFVDVALHELIAGDAEQRQPQTVVLLGQVAAVDRHVAARAAFDLGARPLQAAGLPEVTLYLLVDRGVHEESQDGRRRAVDRHRYGGRRIAQVEARVKTLHVVDGGDRNPGVADLAPDVRPQARIRAVERDRVERRGQAVRRLPARHEVEAPVRALGDPLAREHPGRFLAASPVGVDARGVGVGAGQVVLHQEAQQVAPVRILGQRQLRHPQVAQRRDVVVARDLAAADRVAVLVSARGVDALGPLLQEFRGFGADFGECLLIAPAKASQALVGRRLQR